MTDNTEATTEPEVDATEAAAAIADEHDVNLSEVEGSGVEGRVTKSDVEQHLAEKEQAEATMGPTIKAVHARIDALVARLGGLLGVRVED